LAGAKICGCKVICGATFRQFRRLFRNGNLDKIFAEYSWEYGSSEEFIEKVRATEQAHLRTLEMPADEFLQAVSGHISCVDAAKPSLNGRFELIHYVREVAISFDYHRYGNLMDREGEFREPVK
jgi:RHH-type proline utilization regulon transcriptional repressor/proline dehydrogenase/delta 1-pyrroline-5-carboxylate dehydrogenase